MRRDETLLHPETLRGIPGTARWLTFAVPGLTLLEKNHASLAEEERLVTLTQLNVLEQMVRSIHILP